jgi:hypothetical protein
LFIQIDPSERVNNLLNSRRAMKVKKHDDNALVIEDFPMRIGIFGFSMALFAAGALVYTLLHSPIDWEKAMVATAGFLISFFGGAAFAKRSVFVFDRKARSISFRRRGLFENTSKEIPFDAVREVAVQVRPSDTRRSYRVALLMERDEIPIAPAYSAGRKALCDDVADTIRSVLGST